MAGHDGDPKLFELGVKEIEEDCSVDPDPEEITAPQRRIADIEDDSSARFPTQAADALAALHCDLIQAQVMQDRESCWLKQKTRSDWLGLVESFKNRDAVAVTSQEKCSCHTGNATPCDRNVQCPGDMCPRREIARPSARWPDGRLRGA
jgi:hypothetical protein